MECSPDLLLLFEEHDQRRAVQRRYCPAQVAQAKPAAPCQRGLQCRIAVVDRERAQCPFRRPLPFLAGRTGRVRCQPRRGFPLPALTQLRHDRPSTRFHQDVELTLKVLENGTVDDGAAQTVMIPCQPFAVGRTESVSSHQFRPHVRIGNRFVKDAFDHSAGGPVSEAANRAPFITKRFKQIEIRRVLLTHRLPPGKSCAPPQSHRRRRLRRGRNRRYLFLHWPGGSGWFPSSRSDQQ